MTRPLTAPDETIKSFQDELDSVTKNYESRLGTLREEYSRNATDYQQRISSLDTFREPMIGEGEMPFLIMVEYFTEGGLREHGHIYGRTRRASDSQVWTFYDANGQAQNSPCDWITLVNTYLMRSDQSVRLHEVEGYKELARHNSLSAKVSTFPEFNGRTVVRPDPQPATPAYASDTVALGELRAYVQARLVGGDVVQVQRNPAYRPDAIDQFGGGFGESAYTTPFVVERDPSVRNNARS